MITILCRKNWMAFKIIRFKSNRRHMGNSKRKTVKEKTKDSSRSYRKCERYAILWIRNSIDSMTGRILDWIKFKGNIAKC